MRFTKTCEGDRLTRSTYQIVVTIFKYFVSAEVIPLFRGLKLSEESRHEVFCMKYLRVFPLKWEENNGKERGNKIRN